MKALAFALLLAGCATQPPPSEVDLDAWRQHRQSVSAVDEWRAIGKLAVKSPQKGTSAGLDWVQRGDAYRILLSGPLGFGSALIEGNADMAQMQYDGQTLFKRPDELVLQATGIALPVDSWCWWLRGIPIPDERPVKALATNPQGQASGFLQRGWTLSFSGYKRTAIGFLPSKIRGQSANLSFKLMVSEWRTTDSQ